MLDLRLMDFYFHTEAPDLCNSCVNFVPISFVDISYINLLLMLDKNRTLRRRKRNHASQKRLIVHTEMMYK